MEAKYTIVKIDRGQYQVVDQDGKEYFAYPTSKHEANLFIIESKVDARFMAHEGIRKVAMKYINDNKIPVNEYGDLQQFIANYVYKAYHGDMRKMMEKPSLFRKQIEITAAKNKAAREASLINNHMETAEKNPVTIQEEAHGLIHEIAFNVREGNIELAQQQIKRVDELLHIMCEPGGISH